MMRILSHIKRARFVPHAMLIAMLSYGCASVRTELIAPCPAKSESEILKALTSLIVAEGLRVRTMNADVGFLDAETTELASGNSTHQNRWTFTLVNDSVRAYATSVTGTRNEAGVVTSSHDYTFDDGVPKNQLWYWSVRNGLEKFCGVPIVFVKHTQPVMMW
ncbi:MAG: hypothetical protein H7X80_00550 [bacterium]|nr:hypothetical protein [Candidatus Kapabacteria bacterium]